VSLDGNKRKLVKLLAQYDNYVTVKEMRENPDIEELYEAGSLRNVLSDLAFDKDSDDTQKHLKREKEGRKWKYQVSNYGRRKIKEWKKTEQDYSTDSEEIGFGEAVQLFEEYFAEEAYDKVASAVKSGQSHIEVDLMNLDVFNPELYDYIRNNPDTALEAASEGIEAIDLLTEEKLEIRFYNLDEGDKIALSEISHSQNIGRYASAEGVVIYNSRTLPELVAGIFECSQCGDRYRKEQDSSQIKSPYKCDCGSRKFKLEEKILTNSKVLKIQERESNRRKINVSVKGELAKNDKLEKTSLGSLIKVNGVVREAPLKKNSKKYDVYLEANSIEFKDKNRLEEIEEDTKDKVRKLSEDPEIKEKLKQTVAKGAVGGLERVKEAYLVYRLGKTKDGNLHLLIAGEPDVGKSLLGDTSSKNLPRTTYTVLKGTTEKGLTASFDTEDGEEQEYRAGDLVECDDGFFIGDEAGKFSGNYNIFNTPMQQERVNRSATGRKVDLPASVSICLITNPVKQGDGRQWDGYPSVDQIPLKSDTDTLSRFDIQIAIPEQRITDEDSLRREQEKAGKVLQDMQGIETPVDFSVYKAYLSMAEDIEPEMPAECKNLLKKIYLGLSLKDYTTSPRVLEALKKMSKAYARIRLEEKVSTERVVEAYKFWRNCRATLYKNFRTEANSISKSNGFTKDEVTKLGEAVKILGENGGEMEKKALKSQLNLGGSPTEKEKRFAEIVEAGLDADAWREKGSEIRLIKEKGFMGDKQVDKLLDDSVLPEGGGIDG
jgi:DNA replicative helicase MCM subunit Mcm2 (Cdc46/Mcm family)